MKSWASESKPFHSRSIVEILGRPRRKEQEPFQIKGSAHEKFGVWTGPKILDWRSLVALGVTEALN